MAITEDEVRIEVERLCKAVIALEKHVPADEPELVDHLVDARNALIGARGVFQVRDHGIRRDWGGS